MRIRILTSRDRHPVGVVVDVDEVTARGWIAAGDAEVETAPSAPPIETAVASDVVETRQKKAPR